MDKAELAIRGAAAATVNKAEVRRLILVASSAYRVQKDLGLADDDFDTWRKGILWETVRKASFRALGQAEFGKAMDAFLKLAGRPAASAPARGWSGKNASIARNETGSEGDRRRAEFKLREGCRETAEAFGSEAGALAYALVLLQQIHHLPQGQELEKATAQQLWKTLFTLRNRAAQRLRKAMREAAR